MAMGIAFAFPRLGNRWFTQIERKLGKLARRKNLAVFVTGAAALVGRLALLPWFPIPLPFVPDDFSFLLAADTFAHGRLANPTPPMWVHFESIHISMQPTYTSMYFPGPGLIMALGQVLFGHPWYGLLFANALMCAAICWMLQAWLPPTWALLGGALAVVRLALFSYWINTYHGGGALAALGGALVLGSLPSLRRKVRLRHVFVLAIGIVTLAYTRPYEGVLLCLTVPFFFLRGAFRVRIDVAAPAGRYSDWMRDARLAPLHGWDITTIESSAVRIHCHTPSIVPPMQLFPTISGNIRNLNRTFDMKK